MTGRTSTSEEVTPFGTKVHMGHFLFGFLITASLRLVLYIDCLASLRHTQTTPTKHSKRSTTRSYTTCARSPVSQTQNLQPEWRIISRRPPRWLPSTTTLTTSAQAQKTAPTISPIDPSPAASPPCLTETENEFDQRRRRRSTDLFRARDIDQQPGLADKAGESSNAHAHARRMSGTGTATTDTGDTGISHGHTSKEARLDCDSDTSYRPLESAAPARTHIPLECAGGVDYAPTGLTGNWFDSARSSLVLSDPILAALPKLELSTERPQSQLDNMPDHGMESSPGRGKNSSRPAKARQGEHDLQQLEAVASAALVEAERRDEISPLQQPGTFSRNQRPPHLRSYTSPTRPQLQTLPQFQSPSPAQSPIQAQAHMLSPPLGISELMVQATSYFDPHVYHVREPGSPFPSSYSDNNLRAGAGAGSVDDSSARSSSLNNDPNGHSDSAPSRPPAQPVHPSSAPYAPSDLGSCSSAAGSGTRSPRVRNMSGGVLAPHGSFTSVKRPFGASRSYSSGYSFSNSDGHWADAERSPASEPPDPMERRSWQLAAQRGDQLAMIKLGWQRSAQRSHSHSLGSVEDIWGPNEP